MDDPATSSTLARVDISHQDQFPYIDDNTALNLFHPSLIGNRLVASSYVGKGSQKTCERGFFWTSASDSAQERRNCAVINTASVSMGPMSSPRRWCQISRVTSSLR